MRQIFGLVVCDVICIHRRVFSMSTFDHDSLCLYISRLNKPPSLALNYTIAQYSVQITQKKCPLGFGPELSNQSSSLFGFKHHIALKIVTILSCFSCSRQRKQKYFHFVRFLHDSSLFFLPTFDVHFLHAFSNLDISIS